MLYHYLKNKGYNTKLISFPEYRTSTGRLIYKFLYDSWQPNKILQHILFEVNRLEVMNKIDMSNYDFIISNRYTMSGKAYAYARLNGILTHSQIDRLLYPLTYEMPAPNYVFILDIDPKVSFKRKQQNRDKFEQDIQFLIDVRSQFQKMTTKNDWYLIDANKPKEDVHQQILKILQNGGLKL